MFGEENGESNLPILRYSEIGQMTRKQMFEGPMDFTVGADLPCFRAKTASERAGVGLWID